MSRSTVTVKLHSPGPWKVVKAIETWMVASCGDGLIIQSAPCPGDALGSAEDDATLIASAPEMLSALKYILPALRDAGHATMIEGISAKCPTSCDLCIVEAAIAKAEGKQDVRI